MPTTRHHAQIPGYRHEDEMRRTARPVACTAHQVAGAAVAGNGHPWPMISNYVPQNVCVTTSSGLGGSAYLSFPG